MTLIINKKTIIPIIILVLGLVAEGVYLLVQSTNPAIGDNQPQFADQEVVASTTTLSKIEPEQSATTTKVVEVSGVIEPAEEVLVSPKMSGRLVRLYIKEGDRVETGQLIAQLEEDPTLLASLNNARANLTNTIAAVNKDITAAEVAVRTAQTNFDNTKINANESVRQAEIAVQAAEIALKNASQTKANTTDTSQQAVEHAYEKLKITLAGNLTTALTALTAAGDIIGEEPGDIHANDYYEDFLGVKKLSTFYESKNLFAQAKEKYEQANSFYNNLSPEASFSEIDKVATEVSQALDLIKETLTAVRVMLDNTITTSHFSSANLTALKTATDGNLASVNGAISALTAAKQGVVNARLANKSSTDSVQSGYQQAQTNLESARQALALAKTQAKAKIDAAAKQLEAAQTNLASVKKRAKQQIDAARGQVDSVLAQLSNTKITAPVSGLVSKIYLDTGEMAVAGQPLVTIVNTNGFKIEVALSDVDITKVKVGQEAEIILSAAPEEKISGRVYYVASVADPVSRKFPVKIQIDNKSKIIKAGLIARVKIIVE
jgi:multidrug efflux pump subunit AcrA (membrane-fusion protein)